jgi:hypothetical protein
MWEYFYVDISVSSVNKVTNGRGSIIDRNVIFFFFQNETVTEAYPFF